MQRGQEWNAEIPHSWRSRKQYTFVAGCLTANRREGRKQEGTRSNEGWRELQWGGSGAEVCICSDFGPTAPRAHRSTSHCARTQYRSLTRNTIYQSHWRPPPCPLLGNPGAFVLQTPPSPPAMRRWLRPFANPGQIFTFPDFNSDSILFSYLISSRSVKTCRNHLGK